MYYDFLSLIVAWLPKANLHDDMYLIMFVLNIKSCLKKKQTKNYGQGNEWIDHQSNKINVEYLYC